jgi:hypothetical protein
MASIKKKITNNPPKPTMDVVNSKSNFHAHIKLHKTPIAIRIIVNWKKFIIQSSHLSDKNTEMKHPITLHVPHKKCSVPHY